jgi:uncharacterized radical SAM superfamily protein
MDTNKLWDKVNLIVTSDHGMTTIDTSNQVVDITDHVDMNSISFTVDNGPIMQIHPAEGQIDQVIQSLQNVSHINTFVVAHPSSVTKTHPDIRRLK